MVGAVFLDRDLPTQEQEQTVHSKTAGRKWQFILGAATFISVGAFLSAAAISFFAAVGLVQSSFLTGSLTVGLLLLAFAAAFTAAHSMDRLHP